jgi:hypothetical protein
VKGALDAVRRIEADQSERGGATRQADAAVQVLATSAGASASVSTFRSTASAVVGSTAVAMKSKCGTSIQSWH